MSRKTIILREDQFNEICGTNTAYFDNSNDYAEDGTTTVKAAGAVSDDNGEKEYSDPVTGKEWGHELAPETLFALLFRNGGHGLWGHWGSGLRSKYLSEEVDPEADVEEMIYYKALHYIKKYSPDLFENSHDEVLNAVEDVMHNISDTLDGTVEECGLIVAKEAMKKIDNDYYDEEVAPFLNESNSELEGTSWNLDLGDGKKKRSYTSLTTEKNELEQEIARLRMQHDLSPEGQGELEKKVDRLYRINMKLGMETKRVRDSKRVKKDIFGDNNAFIKPHSKDSNNGKAHKKKVKDPNVGTGYITYND